jgi:biopolymer transport protein ExbD
MGMSAGGDRKAVKSEINVTPLVDIVLVLLIIFLVLTPIKMRHITLEVPRKMDTQTEVNPLASKQITVYVRDMDDIDVINGSEKTNVGSNAELAEFVGGLLEKKRTEKVVFVDFKDEVEYGVAVTIMDTLKGVGAEKVALKIRVEEQAAGG